MSANPSGEAGVPLTPSTALLIAGAVWAGLMLILLGTFAFAFALTVPTIETYIHPATSHTFMPVALIACVLVAAAGLAHYYLFRRSWQAGLVKPSGYVLASLVLWVGITLPAELALVGMILDHSLFPNILIAALLVLLLMSTWPSGHQMLHRRPRAAEDDDVEIFHLPEDAEE